jgi:hypothetical protein
MFVARDPLLFIPGFKGTTGYKEAGLATPRVAMVGYRLSPEPVLRLQLRNPREVTLVAGYHYRPT